jgi:mannosyltransferase OCH1-like enzyme
MTIKYNNIFQTHKSIEYINSKPKIKSAVKSWLKNTSNFRYHFYDDAKCDKFMKEIVGGTTYDAYQRLPIKVMKADLWRYCVIYEYGGIYADTDTICKVNPNLFLNEALYIIIFNIIFYTG